MVTQLPTWVFGVQVAAQVEDGRAAYHVPAPLPSQAPLLFHKVQIRSTGITFVSLPDSNLCLYSETVKFRATEAGLPREGEGAEEGAEETRVACGGHSARHASQVAFHREEDCVEVPLQAHSSFSSVVLFSVHWATRHTSPLLA